MQLGLYKDYVLLIHLFVVKMLYFNFLS